MVVVGEMMMTNTLVEPTTNGTRTTPKCQGQKTPPWLVPLHTHSKYLKILFAGGLFLRHYSYNCGLVNFLLSLFAHNWKVHSRNQVQ